MRSVQTMLALMPELHENGLLRRLPIEDRARLRRRMQRLQLGQRDTVYAADSLMRRVYFPTRGLLSVVVELDNGRVLNVAEIGPEGMAGISLFFEGQRARHLVVTVIEGECFTMTALAFQEEVDRSASFRAILQKYSNAYISTLAHTAACNGSHHADKRLARLLLMCEDGARNEHFAITQDDLATALGLQRPAISLAAEALRQRNVISYRRGKLRVLDRPRLEKEACECYRRIRSEYDAALS
jgi:CRP-like cAMP-binding protein